MRSLLFIVSFLVFAWVFVESVLFQDNNILGKSFAQLPYVTQVTFAFTFYGSMLCVVLACIFKLSKLS